MFIKPLVLSWTHTDNYMKEHDYRSLVAPTVKTMQYSDHPDSRLIQPVNLADLQKREEKKKERLAANVSTKKVFVLFFCFVVVVVVLGGKVKKNAFTKRHNFFSDEPFSCITGKNGY